MDLTDLAIITLTLAGVSLLVWNLYKIKKENRRKRDQLKETVDRILRDMNKRGK